MYGFWTIWRKTVWRNIFSKKFNLIKSFWQKTLRRNQNFRKDNMTSVIFVKKVRVWVSFRVGKSYFIKLYFLPNSIGVIMSFVKLHFFIKSVHSNILFCQLCDPELSNSVHKNFLWEWENLKKKFYALGYAYEIVFWQILLKSYVLYTHCTILYIIKKFGCQWKFYYLLLLHDLLRIIDYNNKNSNLSIKTFLKLILRLKNIKDVQN